MENTSYIALSRQSALRREMDVIAHNVANMNSTAYKGEKMMFVEHLAKSRDDLSFIPRKLAFTRDVAQYRNLSEGPIQTTGNTFDMAIRGDGYFVVQRPDGSEAYTRGAALSVTPNGQLVTSSGRPVLDNEALALIQRAQLPPQRQAWCRSKLEWASNIEALPQFDKSAG